jgi:hypothetical protein
MGPVVEIRPRTRGHNDIFGREGGLMALGIDHLQGAVVQQAPVSLNQVDAGPLQLPLKLVNEP